MKSSKPKGHELLHELTPEKTHELFMSVEFLNDYMTGANIVRGSQSFEWLMSRLGKNVFVFDVDSCEIFEKGEK